MATQTVVPMEEVALVVHPDDNVAVAKTRISEGTIVLWNGRAIEVRETIPPGHRFALTDLPEGIPVRQYGQPFGISKGVRIGERITRERIRNELPPRIIKPASKNAPPDYFPDEQIPTWQGYRRKDGRAGTRNFVLVVPTSMCASTEAMQIAMRAELLLWSPEEYPNVSGVVALPHNKGCGCPDGTPVEMLMKVLGRYIEHPNVAAALVIQLGCGGV